VIRKLAALLCAAAALSPAQDKVTDAINRDPILNAMISELGRVRQLRLLMDPPYFVECTVEDAEMVSAAATLGAALAPNRVRLRPFRVGVRVGTPRFDNTGSIFTDIPTGTRYDPDTLPVEGSGASLRQPLWLAFDRGYKTAVEAIGRKQAALRGVTVTDPLMDFNTAPKLQLVQEIKRIKIDEDQLSQKAKTLSSVFRAFPGITSSTVELEASQSVFYYANTEASVVRVPDRVALMRVRAWRQAEDGMDIYDGASFVSIDPMQLLNSDAELRSAVEKVARNVEALAKSPVGENYTGPVLFEPEAAAQLFGEMLGGNLGVQRKPVAEPGRALQFQGSEFESRLNARVLPEWMSVIDDPTQTQWNGVPLAGHYEADLEGVKPTRLTLIENGTLKAFLTSRQPVRGMTESNGRARLPGAFGSKTVRPGNLEIGTSQSVSLSELKLKMMEMVKQQSRPYGLIIRKMDFPSSGAVEGLRRSGATRGGGRTVSAPILAYRVYADGREELVRGLRFRGLTTRSLRDISAASTEKALFQYLDNGARLAIQGASSFVVGCSVVSPAILFEDLELEPFEGDLLKLPVVPPPDLSASASK
jgi:hypothetical protein